MTDAIFANLRRANRAADNDPHTLRISMDTKATVHVGEYSRRGQSRGLQPVAALDHEMQPKEKLVPVGILEPAAARSFIAFGNSNKTSDFMVDVLHLWWTQRQPELPQLRHLLINLDNGPECSGHRSQFLARLVAFADATGLQVRLIYYPPYHSKYNAIEHFWGGLERSWNGYLLDCVQTVLRRAATFTWRKLPPKVILIDRAYAKGVKLSAAEKRILEARIERAEDLPWWDVTIKPKPVV